jgi:hypothetical protein
MNKFFLMIPALLAASIVSAQALYPHYTWQTLTDVMGIPDACFELQSQGGGMSTVTRWECTEPQPTPAEIDAAWLPVARAECATEYEAQAVAVIDAGWPVLAQMQAAVNPPSMRVACYDEDLVEIDAALDSAIDALDGLTVKQLTPCPAVTWPAMRLYTQEQIDNAEVELCEQ